MNQGDPLSKFACIRDGGRQKHKSGSLGRENYGLFPHNSPLLVP